MLVYANRDAHIAIAPRISRAVAQQHAAPAQRLHQFRMSSANLHQHKIGVARKELHAQHPQSIMTFMLRPEEISLSSTPQLVNSIVGKVGSATYSGSFTNYRIVTDL